MGGRSILLLPICCVTLLFCNAVQACLEAERGRNRVQAAVVSTLQVLDMAIDARLTAVVHVRRQAMTNSDLSRVFCTFPMYSFPISFVSTFKFVGVMTRIVSIDQGLH